MKRKPVLSNISYFNIPVKQETFICSNSCKDDAHVKSGATQGTTRIVFTNPIGLFTAIFVQSPECFHCETGLNQFSTKSELCIRLCNFILKSHNMYSAVNKTKVKGQNSIEVTDL